MRPPDAAILDLILPDGNGIDICRSIREWSEMPILVLSAVGEEAEKVRALDAGADDYVTKPFGPDELIARLNAALRRAGAAARTSRCCRSTASRSTWPRHRVPRDGEEVHLTPTEFDLLRVLARNRGRLMTHRALLARGLGARLRGGHADAARAHRQPAPQDRAGARSAPRYIRTDPGVGLPLRGLDGFLTSYAARRFFTRP